MEIEIEIFDYKENFNSEITWENKVNMKIDNILNDYNPVEALATKAEKPKRTYEK